MLRINDNIIEFELHGIPLIGNPENSALIGLTQEGFSFFQDLKKANEIKVEDFPNSQEELANALLSQGFIIDIDHIEEQGNQVSVCYLHITSHCNLNCVGCYSNEANRNNIKNPDVEQIDSTLEKLKEFNLQTLVFSGGEPLVYPDIREVLVLAKEKYKIPFIHLITNGTVDVDEYAEIYNLVDQISFSLDGYKSGVSYLRPEGIYDKVINNIKRAAEHVKTNIIATVHKKNIEQILNYQALSEELESTLNISLFITEDPDGKKQFQLSDEEYKKIGKISMETNITLLDTSFEESIGCATSCGVGKDIISVQSNGDVHPCHMFFGDKFKMGNIFKESLDNILNNYDSEIFNVDNIEECKNCQYRYLCGGGCRYRAYAYYGKLGKRDPLCSLFQEKYKTIFERIDK